MPSWQRTDGIKASGLELRSCHGVSGGFGLFLGGVGRWEVKVQPSL